MSQASRHILMTVLGTNPQNARYGLGDREAQARIAVLALLDLLPEDEKPDHVVALCTSEARKETLPFLLQGLPHRYTLESVEIPAGHTQDDLDTFLTRAAEVVPEGPPVELSVDVTHGYRHFSFLTYTAVLYLSALRGVPIRGFYYGLLRRDAVSPFLDLKPLLALPHWFHALKVLDETGSALPIAKLLGDGPQSPFSREIGHALTRLSAAYLSGLPVELGQQARRFCEQKSRPLTRLLQNEHHLPLARELVGSLTNTLDRFRLPGPVDGHGWKRRVPLSKEELERQAHLIDALLQRENLATALGLMDEWTVSWAAWCIGDEDHWLDYQRVRRRAANLLGAIAAVGKDPDLGPIATQEQRALGAFWDLLCELRNGYHHHGMRWKSLVGNRHHESQLEKVQRYWEETLRQVPKDIPLALRGARVGRLLVSPIGRRPGVLFSALQVARDEGDLAPAHCLVICSPETETLIKEAMEQAQYAGPWKSLVLEDPYGGRTEIERVVKTARKTLVEADEVLVNVTGGTTLLGLVAHEIAAEARRFARPVRRFGLIDRRRPEQQDKDPYQTGEAFWLDTKEGGDEQGD